MAIPVYLWLKDDGGTDIKGSVEIRNYRIGSPHQNRHTGAYTINLEPNYNNNMCGRSLFRIHGASGKHPLASSDGCIVAPLNVRKAIWMSGDTELIVK